MPLFYSINLFALRKYNCTVSLLFCFPVVTDSINGLTEVLESTTIKTEVLESATFKTVEEKVRIIFSTRQTALHNNLEF